MAGEALARAARARRAELGISQEEVREVSGLSVTTIAKIEAGDGSVSAASLARYDRALGWPEGTAEAWRDTGRPLAPPPGELIEWVSALAPMVAAQLRDGVVPPDSISVAGLPADVVDALERVVVAVRGLRR